MKNNKIRHTDVIVSDEKRILNPYQYMKLLNNNNVIRDRVELYRDFVVNLIHYIHTTYFGKSFINNEEDVSGHFNWAFQKVISDFKDEDIFFPETKELKEYFYRYFLEKFYSADTLPPLKYYIAFWDDIFSLNPDKSKTMLNALIEVYLIFDKALNPKGNLVEEN